MRSVSPVRRIVVGIDGTAAAAAAVRWAVREARLRRAVVELVHAYHVDPRLRAPYAPFSQAPPAEECEAIARAQLHAAKAFACRRLGTRRVRIELTGGLPSRALLARAVAAEMLVLGTTTPPVQQSVAMGPVARTCLRSAPCPVVIVRSVAGRPYRSNPVLSEPGLQPELRWSWLFPPQRARGAATARQRSSTR